MQTINIHQAKTHLSRLVEEASKGKTFIIAKAGKPMVKVSPLTDGDIQPIQRLGFMTSEIFVPDDFDSLESSYVAELFEGDES